MQVSRMICKHKGKTKICVSCMYTKQKVYLRGHGKLAVCVIEPHHNY